MVFVQLIQLGLDDVIGVVCNDFVGDGSNDFEDIFLCETSRQKGINVSFTGSAAFLNHCLREGP